MRWLAVFVLGASLLLSSCSSSLSVNNGSWLQKRKYSKGFFFNPKTNSHPPSDLIVSADPEPEVIVPEYEEVVFSVYESRTSSFFYTNPVDSPTAGEEVLNEDESSDSGEHVTYTYVHNTKEQSGISDGKITLNIFSVLFAIGIGILAVLALIEGSAIGLLIGIPALTLFILAVSNGGKREGIVWALIGVLGVLGGVVLIGVGIGGLAWNIFAGIVFIVAAILLFIQSATALK